MRPNVFLRLASTSASNQLNYVFKSTYHFPSSSTSFITVSKYWICGWKINKIVKMLKVCEWFSESKRSGTHFYLCLVFVLICGSKSWCGSGRKGDKEQKKTFSLMFRWLLMRSSYFLLATSFYWVQVDPLTKSPLKITTNRRCINKNLRKKLLNQEDCWSSWSYYSGWFFMLHSESVCMLKHPTCGDQEEKELYPRVKSLSLLPALSGKAPSWRLGFCRDETKRFPLVSAGNRETNQP